VVAAPEVLFRGGPVGTDGALAVARLRDPQDQPVGWRPVVGLVGMVDLDTPTELVDGSVTAMRVFAGYAGWGAGQLDGEVERGDWYVVTSESGDAFHGDTTALWRDVMRRQPGMLAWHVNRPVDPEMN
jgi:putative transcriptional regulator